MDVQHETYHLYIANRSRVHVKKLNGANELTGEIEGRFRYTAARRRCLGELHNAASAGTLTSDQVQQLGELLFETLLDDKLQLDFFSVYKHTQDVGAILRVTLEVDEDNLPHIAALPWEFLCVPPDKGYGTLWLSTAPGIVFARHRARWAMPAPITVRPDEPLRIAVVVGAPGELGPVQYQTIWEGLREFAIDPQHCIELFDLVSPATSSAIDALLERRPHILHFIGHGRLRDDQGREVGQIALQDGVSTVPLWRSATQFSDLLNRYRPAVVLLQACEGAALSSSQAFVGVASRIVDQNIPVVIAMQYEVTNSTARRFALEFYRRLSRHEAVDRAVQEGRRTIALGPTGYDTRDFATPVLFMRGRDGYLFTMPEPASVALAGVVPAPGVLAIPVVLPQVINDLTSLLSKCENVKRAATRQTIVSMLPPEVQNAISRDNALQADVFNIVKTSADYPDGLKQLIAAVRFFEGNSFQMQAVCNYLSTNALALCD